MPLSKEQLRQSKLRMGTIRQAREAVKGARERRRGEKKETERCMAIEKRVSSHGEKRWPES